MWHAYLATLLSKAALPLAGAALAVVLSLSAALWWTSGRLSDARDRLSQAQADTLTCVQANASQRETIDELRRAQDLNRRSILDLRRREQDAINRVTELEARQDEQTTETIERVIRIADGDACASLPIPDRLRNAASGDADRNGRGSS